MNGGSRGSASSNVARSGKLESVSSIPARPPTEASGRTSSETCSGSRRSVRASAGTFGPILAGLTLPRARRDRDRDMAVETRTRRTKCQSQETTTEAFVGRALADLAATYGGVMVSVGHRLGLYRALAGQGPVSSHELAARTGCDERYVREWLNSQVVAGYLALPRRVGDVRAAGRARARARGRGEPGRSCRARSTCPPRCGSTRSGRSRPSARARASRGATTTGGSSAASPTFYRNAYGAVARAGVASGARRRRREARAGRARGGHRLRPRALDDADGVGVRALALRRLRHARGVDRGRARRMPRRPGSPTASGSSAPTPARTRARATT